MLTVPQNSITDNQSTITITYNATRKAFEDKITDSKARILRPITARDKAFESQPRLVTEIR